MYRIFAAVLLSLLISFGASHAADKPFGGGSTTVTVQRYPHLSLFAAAPANPSVVYGYATSYDKGDIYKSSNGGSSWSKTASFPDLGYTVKKFVAGFSPNQLFMLTSNGLFRSNDDGASWAAIVDSYAITAMAIDPAQPATMYAGAAGLGVIKSTDGGNTWAISSTGIAASTINSLLIGSNSSNVVFAATSAGIFKSYDGGEAWSDSSEGLPASAVNDIKQSRADASVFYAATGSGFYRSADSGASWSQQSTRELPGFSVLSGEVLVGGDSRSTDSGVTWSYTGNADLADAWPSTIWGYSAEFGAYVSSDSGATWSSYTSGLPQHSETSGGQQKTGVPGIAFHVASDSGAGLAGAVINCNTVQVISDSNGYAVIYGGSSCTAQVSARGYVTASIYAPVISLGYAPATEVTLTQQQVVVSTGTDGNGTITPSSVTITGPQRATLTVSPNEGYKVQSVSGCGGFLNGATFTTATVGSSCTVQAKFAPATAYNVAPVSLGHGTISPSTTQSVLAGSSTTFSVLPADGYQVMSVSGCAGTLDGNSYTTAAIAANCTVSASFGRAVTFSAGANGTVTGNTSQVVANGGSASAVTAVPDTGYDFVNWTGTGGFVTSSSNPLTLTNVQAAQDIRANFSIKTFTVTPAVIANGSITPATPQSAEYNSTRSFTLVPAAGYQLTSVTGCGGTLSGDIYTTAPATADCTVAATFSPVVVFVSGGNGSVTGSTTQVVAGGASTTAVEAVPATGFKFVNWTGSGGLVSSSNPLIIDNVLTAMTVTANFAVQTFAVTPAAGANGSISPGGAQAVNYNTAASFTIVPDAGFELQSVSGCGGTLSGSTYTTSAVLADCTINASFGRAVTFAANNGTITGNISQIIANGGSTTAVTAVPDLGYRFVNWTGTGGFESSANPLTLNSVTSPLSLTANFAILTFSVRPLASSDGTLTPETPITVNYGQPARFSVTAKDGYKLLLPVGGTCPGGSVTEGGYSTGPITADCTVQASFAPASHAAIPGDCDNSGSVSIAEVQSAINMFLGVNAVESCVDLDGGTTASIDEVQKTINTFLGLQSSSPLVSIAVEPADPSIALGGTQQFRAVGSYADNTTQDLTLLASWSSSAASVAPMSGASAPGKATASAAGSTVITASYGGTSGNTTLSVSPALLLSIAVGSPAASPPVGTTTQFTAIGTYSDGSTHDLTAAASWNSSAAAVAEISSATGAAGKVTAKGIGSATITATVGSVAGTGTVTVTPAALVSIAVTPGSASAAIGRSTQFFATGTYTDNSSRDLSAAVSWRSSDPAVAAISNLTGSNGKATAAAIGTATVSASLDGLTATAILNAAPAELVSVSVAPATATVTTGGSQQFTATGTYTDNTTRDITQSASWSSQLASVATFGNAGLATAAATGFVQVSATLGAISGNATLTVVPALVSLSISPANSVVPLGTVVQCSAYGSYSDSSSQNLTSSVSWSSSSTGVASAGSTAGSFSTSGIGTTTITATKGSVSNSTSLRVVGNFRGTWSGSWSSPPFGGCGAGSGSISFSMTQSGAQVSSGAFGLPWIGTVTDSAAQMQVNCCNYQKSTWTVSGNTMTGTVPVTCGTSEYMAPFTVTRQ